MIKLFPIFLVILLCWYKRYSIFLIISNTFILLEFLISFFISSNSFSRYFTNTSLSWLIFEHIKALEVKTSTIFNLVFAINTISLSFFFFFLIIDLCFLIHEVPTEIFIVIAELVTFIGIPTKDAREEIETYPVSAETKISKYSV